MALQVFTARISYTGEDRLDVTRKSGGKDGTPFAPSWAILAPALEARRTGADMVATWERYVHAFMKEMRSSYRRDRASWDALVKRERVVLVCYCTDAERCHRRLLRAVILPKLGCVDRGELGPTKMTADTLGALSRLFYAEAAPKPHRRHGPDELNDVPMPPPVEALRLKDTARELAGLANKRDAEVNGGRPSAEVLAVLGECDAAEVMR
jgi:uncharacterized protein YeaO (DUF488 family)